MQNKVEVERKIKTTALNSQIIYILFVTHAIFCPWKTMLLVFPLRWCYTRRFAPTIFSATQGCNIVTILFRTVTTLFQHCNAALRLKSSLRIVPCNITFSFSRFCSSLAKRETPTGTLYVLMFSRFSYASLAWLKRKLNDRWAGAGLE